MSCCRRNQRNPPDMRQESASAPPLALRCELLSMCRAIDEIGKFHRSGQHRPMSGRQIDVFGTDMTELGDHRRIAGITPLLHDFRGNAGTDQGGRHIQSCWIFQLYRPACYADRFGHGTASRRNRSRTASLRPSVLLPETSISVLWEAMNRATLTWSPPSPLEQRFRRIVQRPACAMNASTSTASGHWLRPA